MRRFLVGLVGLAAILVAAPRSWAADAVLRATLPNGLQVVIVPDHLAPVVTTELNYLAGSNDAPAGFPGTAHALEHMMFRGSDGLDRDQLSELGALLGGDYNADTTETVTQYFYTVPAAHLGVALKLESLRMRGLTLSQADWDKERGAIEQEVSRDLSSPIYTYLSQLQAIMFAGTPYEHDALGTRPSFDKTDAALLRRFYNTWYAPNNAILVIAGDVEPARALDLVKASFGGIARRAVPAHAKITLQPVQPKTLALPTDLSVGLVTIGYRMPGLTAQDFATADILSDVLNSERGALYDTVVAGTTLFTQFAFEPKENAGFGVAVGGFPKGGDPKPVLAAVQKVLADIAAHGVPADLVAGAKRQEIAQLAFQANSITGLAESWSRALAFEHRQSPDEIAAAYQAVTLAGVNKLAREILNPAHAVTAILTPDESGKPVAGRGFGGAENFGGTPGKKVALPKWASDALDHLQIPDLASGADVSVLPNGLRLIVHSQHASPTVSVFGLVRQVSDMQEPAGQEGVGSLVAKLFDYGTQKYDRLAFQKALDDIAAQEQAGPRFSLKVLRQDFAAGLALLAENELHPAFPAQYFPVVRQQEAQSLAGLLHSPDYLFDRAVTKATVPQGDKALREATPAGVMKLKLEDVRAYYKAAYRPDLTTIVVIGDISAADARAAVQANFGGWVKDGATPAIDLPPIGPNKASVAEVPDSANVQDSVTLAEAIALPVTNPQRFDVMLGNVVLGGGFSSRLYDDLRVKTGYVYSVSSDLDWSRTRGSYSISFGADPDKVARARSLAIKDVQDLQAAPVSLAELTRAKAQMLRRLPMQRASVDALAALDLRLADLGLPLDTPAIAAQHYFAATPASVQAAFKAWLRPADLAQITKGPAPGK